MTESSGLVKLQDLVRPQSRADDGAEQPSRLLNRVFPLWQVELAEWLRLSQVTSVGAKCLSTVRPS